MTNEEKAEALALLASSSAALAAAVEGVTEEQSQFQPEAGAWSIVQCVEHLNVTERAVLSKVRQQLSAGPPDRSRTPEVAGKERIILERVPFRVRKVPAPEVFQPCGESKALFDAVADFQDARRRTVEFATDSTADLRGYFHDHFALKTLDVYQWLLMLASHTQRHAAQIQEIKSHPDYPATATPRTIGLP